MSKTPIASQHSNPTADDQAAREQVKADSLVGAERPDGEMNWLGSSFSGVDIKVVAHLYGSVEVDAEEQSLANELAFNEEVNKAAVQAVNALPGMNVLALTASPSETFLAAAGVDFGDELSARVANVINVTYQRVPRTGGIIVFRSRLIGQFNTLAATSKITADNLRTKLEKRRAIRQKSSTTIVLATLQTLSVQTYREKMAVRALGNSYCKGYTRGPRTIAGSMIFTVFNEHALAKLIRAMSGRGSLYGERDNELSSLIADQLPPIDLTIVAANEYGQLSRQGIYGVEFVNDGMTMSVEDILTEEVVQFVARDCDVMTSQGNIRLMGDQRGMHFNDEGQQDTTGTSLLFTSHETYNQFLDKIKVRRRLLNR